MLASLKSYLIYGSIHIGLEHYTFNGNEQINVSILKKSKKEITLDKTVVLDKVEALKNELKKGQHISLNINTNKVLTKRIKTIDTNDLKLIHFAFPNIKINDFYYEILRQGNNTFISICRKDYVDAIIETYKQLGFHIINIRLGNLIVSSLTQYLGHSNIITSNSSITIKDGEINSIASLTNPEEVLYTINGLKCSSKFILSQSCALQSFLNNYKSNTNLSVLEKTLLQDFKNIKFYSVFLKSGLVFILGLLLINFLFFNHYYSKSEALKLVGNEDKARIEKITTLKNEVDSIQNTVNNLLSTNSSKSSYFINNLIKELPKSILLSEFNYNPLLKKIQNDKPIKIDKGVIKIIGTSSNSKELTNWVNFLEKKDWVEKVTISYYREVKKEALFELIIKQTNATKI